MPVLKTTSPSTSVSAPNARPTKTVPSSSTSAASRVVTAPPRARSLAYLVNHLTADHRHADDAAKPLALEWRILALRVKLAHVDRPLCARGDHRQVGRRADPQRAGVELEDLGRRDRQQPDQRRELKLADLNQPHQQAERRLQTGDAGRRLVELAVLVNDGVGGVIGGDTVDRSVE